MVSFFFLSVMSRGRRGPATEVWQQVPERRRDMDGQKEDNRQTQQITKFYVANIPEKCSVEDIKSALKEYGTIDGVYVARKINKYGQRFAFVNFVVVNNKHDMETRMRNIKIGDERLFITIGKFVDGKILGKEVKVNDVHHKIDGEIGDRNKLDGENKKPNEEKVASNENGGGSMHGYGGRSFRDTLINKQPDVDITVDPEINAFSIWCDRAVIGRAKDFQRLINLQNWVLERLLNGVGIKYVGGLSVMLVFDNELEAALFLSDEAKWKESFSKVAVWKGQVLVNERIAWLKIFGVPTCIADNAVFNQIGAKFGPIMQPAQLTDEDGDLSYVCIGVLVGEVNRINQMVSIRWHDKMFRARVEEEQNDWIPDCLIDEEDVSEESGSMEVRSVADDDDSGDRNMVTGEDVPS
ncbi:putative RNA recognition motif domain, nucleotide-binding alpha-beta plait domain superfamily [Helianthus annuus]|uniref:RNA recognition motif domain, nucleotide-binding alpha-beta plait domain superfamily n=1 Tax=Helianthus annuus TaxID=4232 RepID=A0A9K3HRN7_HELAN|nr:uncharacterized protein LOC110888854 [Helianthus annuus]KAF5783298.1 putative RNA recognition motif domain, nucleotide-binding alpha-beta plait domain superfamily [Helianthus annuus]KAJ0510793.1 putative RNA recognition motif domain, nucleotide-binding alpha-beta plait domain superfamily [Helianthus annuus]KAJ0518594.1 putative RNA recognition motif domain, nucleotide-binding alpha-beta plait domain superfamily [Helianthus annuus]KAJ0686635.1 putative RNA recognition motif domain, nucleotide